MHNGSVDTRSHAGAWEPEKNTFRSGTKYQKQ